MYTYDFVALGPVVIRFLHFFLTKYVLFCSKPCFVHFPFIYLYSPHNQYFNCFVSVSVSVGGRGFDPQICHNTEQKTVLSLVNSFVRTCFKIDIFIYFKNMILQWYLGGSISIYRIHYYISIL